MTIPKITQTFTDYGDPPVQGMTQSAYDAAAADKMLKDKIHVTEYGTFVSQVNDTAGGIDSAVDEVEADKSTAVTSAAIAVSAAAASELDADRAEAAVAVLPEGTIDDLIVAPDKAWSSQKIDAEMAKLLGEFTVSDWVPGTTKSFTLPTPADEINAINVSVREQIPQIGITNNNWGIETNDTDFDMYDSAYAVNLTLGAVAGDTTATLASGVWAAGDVGKSITSGTGHAVITAQAGTDTADVKIITDFASTSVPSGQWKLSKGMFTDGSFKLSGFEEVDWGAWAGTADGAAAVFESAITTYISSVVLDDTRVLVAYQDEGNSSYGTAVVLTVAEDNTISAGPPLVFATHNSPYTTVALVGPDKVVVCYKENSATGEGRACVLSVTGTAISAGAYVTFEPGATTHISVCKLDTDKALVCYQDAGNSSYGTACVLECYGTTTITPGTPLILTGLATTYLSVSGLDTDKALVCYTASSTGYGLVLTAAGAVISKGNAATFEAAAVSYTSVAALSSTKAVVAYQDNGNSDYGTSCVLEVSGTTVTPGTPVVYASVTAGFNSVTSLSVDQAIVGYYDVNNSDGAGAVLNISSAVITPETPVIFSTSSVQYTSMVTLSDSQAVATFRDLGNSYFGTSKVLNALTADYIDNEFVSAVTNTSGQVNSEYFTDLNSYTPSDTLNSQSAFYGISMDGITYEIVGDGETTLRNVVKLDGVWQYNSNVTYGSETWTAAAVDDLNVAIEEALALTQNQMSSATAAAVADTTWPDFGLVFGGFMAVFSDNPSVSPSVESISFNYDGNIKSQENPLYLNSAMGLDTVEIVSPSDGETINCNVRITRG